MKAVIHIGTQKTGTTTIQSFLGTNRKKLKKRGIFLSTDGSKRYKATWLRHAAEIYHEPELSFCASSLPRETQPSLNNRWQKYRRKIKVKARQCEIRINCCKDDLVLFSDEGLCCLSQQGVENLKEMVDSQFDDVEIVLYLRRQPEYLVSFYNMGNAIASGRSIFDYLDMPEERSRLAYHKMVERWSVFGKDKLKIRIFDKTEFHDNDLLSDFANIVGFDMMGLERVEDRHLSLGSAEVEFFRALYTHFHSQETDVNVRSLKRYFSKRLSGPKKLNKPPKTEDSKAYYLSRKEAQRILDQFREGNDWIAREYLGRDKLFSEDVSMYPEEVAAPHQLTLERSIEISAQLLAKIHSQNPWTTSETWAKKIIGW